MNELTRRAFGKRILAASALPLLRNPILETLRRSPYGQTSNPEPQVIVPDAVASYKLTQEDKPLVAKFLSIYEKNMSALREKDLPNSLAPNFIFASPRIGGESGEARK